jgi:hypothetical protein
MHMPSRSFQATILSGHKEDAVELPFDPGVEWSITSGQFAPGRRGFAVQARLNEVSFASHVVARSGRFWLLVDSQVAGLAGVSTGDSVRVVIEPATTSGRSP